MLECRAVRATQDQMEMRYMVYSTYLFYVQGPTNVTKPGKTTKNAVRSSDDLCSLVKIG